HLPVLQSHPDAERVREHRLPARPRAAAEERDRGARRRRAAARRHRPSRNAFPERALRRRDAARRHRPGDRPPSAADPRRRADRQPRLEERSAHPRAPARDPCVAPPDDRHGHALGPRRGLRRLRRAGRGRTGAALILRALVLRPLFREKTRTTLTIAGIAVGVAVVVAMQLANQSALRAFRESVDERVLLALQPLWRDGVRFAPVIDVEGVLESTQQPIRLLGVDLLSDLHFRDYRYAKIVAGERNAVSDYLALFQPDSLILPAPFAREHGITLGSRVTLSVLGHRSTLVVRGLLEAKGPATARSED